MTRKYIAAEEIARDLGLILDNDESTYTLIRDAAFRGIAEGSGTWTDSESLLMAYQSDRSQFIEPVGIYVRDELYDTLGLSDKGFDEMTLTERLFAQVVAYNDYTLWREFADSHMPDPDDLAEYLAEER